MCFISLFSLNYVWYSGSYSFKYFLCLSVKANLLEPVDHTLLLALFYSFIFFLEETCKTSSFFAHLLKINKLY